MPKIKKVIGSVFKGKKNDQSKNPYELGATESKKAKKKVVEEKGYSIFVVPADDEKALAELRNTGCSLGEIAINTETPDDKVNEVLIVLRKQREAVLPPPFV